MRHATPFHSPPSHTSRPNAALGSRETQLGLRPLDTPSMNNHRTLLTLVFCFLAGACTKPLPHTAAPVAEPEPAPAAALGATDATASTAPHSPVCTERQDEAFQQVAVAFFAVEPHGWTVEAPDGYHYPASSEELRALVGQLGGVQRVLYADGGDAERMRETRALIDPGGAQLIECVPPLSLGYMDAAEAREALEARDRVRELTASQLQESLEGNDWARTLAAVERLSEQRRVQDVESLAGLFESPRDEDLRWQFVARAAQAALVRIGPPAVPTLSRRLAVLSDSEPSASLRLVVDTLAAIGDPSAVPALERAAAAEPEQWLYSRALTRLMPHLAPEDAAVARRAWERTYTALSAVDGEEAIDERSEMLLYRSHAEAAPFDELRRAMTDESFSVRRTARRFFARLANATEAAAFPDPPASGSIPDYLAFARRCDRDWPCYWEAFESGGYPERNKAHFMLLRYGRGDAELIARLKQIAKDPWHRHYFEALELIDQLQTPNVADVVEVAAHHRRRMGRLPTFHRGRHGRAHVLARLERRVER